MFPYVMIVVLNAISPAAAFQQESAGRVQKADPWFGKDKHDHLAVSAFLVSGQVFVLKEMAGVDDRQAVATAVLSTAAIGLGKELYDHVSGRGTASFRDLLADFAGIGFSLLILSNTGK